MNAHWNEDVWLDIQKLGCSIVTVLQSKRTDTKQKCLWKLTVISYDPDMVFHPKIKHAAGIVMKAIYLSTVHITKERDLLTALVYFNYHNDF